MVVQVVPDRVAMVVPAHVIIVVQAVVQAGWVDVTRNVSLILTHSCNLRCGYCYEHAKSNQSMSFSIAKNIVDKEMWSTNSHIVFELFGGEPFIVFKLFKQIVEYIADNIPNNKKVEIVTTTNGTLVHGEIQEWLLKYRNILTVCLSLDGTKNMHDINRDNSFDKIDLDFFAKNYPLQPIKMTISQSTLSQLSDGVIFCHQKGFKINCNLAYGIDWSNVCNRDILERQLYCLMQFYLERNDLEPCSIFNEPLYNISAYEGQAIRTCGAGRGMVAYDCDGRAYACQFFTPLSIGEEKARDSLAIQFHDTIIPEEKLDSRCSECILKPQCHICYGSNYAATDNIYLHDENWCVLNKLLFKARACFYAEKYARGDLKLPTNEEYHVLRSIMLIQEKLKV